MARSVFVFVALLAACGGDDGGDGGGSSEQRICTAIVDCGVLDEANLDDCVTNLEEVDGSRAKDECADCIDANTCGEVDDGVCATDCSSILEAARSTEEIVRELCGFIVACVDGTQAQIDECVTDASAELTHAQALDCEACLDSSTCGNFQTQCEARCSAE